MGLFEDGKVECCLVELAFFGMSDARGLMHAVISDLLFNCHYSKLLPAWDIPVESMLYPLRACGSFVL